MIQPGLGTTLVIAIIVILGVAFHLHYFVRVTNHVRDTSDKSFNEKDLKAALRVPQGSNFNTVMIFSWSISLVAFAFLYFLIPNILPAWNFFEFPRLASDSLGLAYFGIAVIILPGILIALFIPQCYSFYLIPAQLKKMALLAPLFLLVSILCSIYLGTIYPEADLFYWYLGYAALLIALVMMLTPIARGYFEEMMI